MIASYRDWQCRDGRVRAGAGAHPGRVTIAVVQQNRPGDVGCAEPPTPCAARGPSTTPLQVQFADQGLRDGRERGDGPRVCAPRRLPHVPRRGLCDAGRRALRVCYGWDVGIIDQWRRTTNEMAMLSTYLTDVHDFFAPVGFLY
jgi:hypothetical protein